MFGISRKPSPDSPNEKSKRLYWDAELEIGLQCLNDRDLDRLVAAVTTRTQMTTAWGWDRVNPDGTAVVGCLVGSIMSRAEFEQRTRYHDGYLPTREPELVTLACHTFVKWAKTYEGDRTETPAMGWRAVHYPLSPKTMAKLTKLVEAEYNRRHPLRLEPVPSLLPADTQFKLDALLHALYGPDPAVRR